MFSSFWVLKCLACVMRARRDQRKKNEQPLRATNETTTRTNTNKNERHDTLSRVFAFAGETKRDDTKYSFQLYTRTHTRREKSILRDQRQTHAGKVSSNKIPQKKKNERRKATNTTNEDE